MGSWVLHAACKQLRDWRVIGAPQIRVAINISARQFSQTDFVPEVIETAELYSVNPTQLELELTESVVMNNVEQVATQLTALRQAGFHIAIDDFGTGYSSLQYLQQLPLDVLKIDRAFIQELNLPTSCSLIKSIVYLAREFNLRTVAEGVETDLQAERLKDMQCDQLQGFLYSKPVPAANLPAIIEAIHLQ